ncbi:hypothetical protein L195_g002044 [Trifolium pratense]|uniref:CCHC-type domain-containing protein n=1 Tax=Trifolium pratense TaxID=57577 RepID=A0A2K3NRD0_TRIPR|nr:hypothetical protein L195_g002044 [Trifolium pratense]
MASAIGRPIKVDTNTLKVERGRFARVCVEVDLTVPVVGKIWVNGHWYKVQYEGLHLICTNCGCYGHLGRNCTINPVVSKPANTSFNLHHAQNPNSGQPPRPPIADLEKSGVDLNSTPAVTKSGPIINNKEGNNELHGDWLLAHKTKTATSNQSFPPRPKPHEIPRNNNGIMDTKRRRHSDDKHHVPTPSNQPNSASQDVTIEANQDELHPNCNKVPDTPVHIDETMIS